MSIIAMKAGENWPIAQALSSKGGYSPDECPKCRFENVEAAKFCTECGAKLETICSACGRTNLPGSKFCNECGHSLSAPSSTPSGHVPSPRGRAQARDCTLLRPLGLHQPLREGTRRTSLDAPSLVLWLLVYMTRRGSRLLVPLVYRLRPLRAAASKLGCFVGENRFTNTTHRRGICLSSRSSFPALRLRRSSR